VILNHHFWLATRCSSIFDHCLVGLWSYWWIVTKQLDWGWSGPHSEQKVFKF